MSLLYETLIGGSKAKKRLMGVITTQEAKKSMDEYYDTYSNYRGKLLDIMYKKNPKFTYTACDHPEFVECRKTQPNLDGKGDTCLDIAERVCPPSSKGSAKYTRSKKGPNTFDIKGVDSFPKGSKVILKDGREVVSSGIPKSKSNKRLDDLARKQQQERIKKGKKAPVMFKKKVDNKCQRYRKKSGTPCCCEDNSECKWVKNKGCLEKDEEVVKIDTLSISSSDSVDDEDDDDDNELEVLLLDDVMLGNLVNNDLIEKLKYPRIEKYVIGYNEKQFKLYIYNELEETTKFLGTIDFLKKVNINLFIRDLDYLGDLLKEEDDLVVFKKKDMVELEEVSLVGGSVDLNSESTIESKTYLINNKTGKIYSNDGNYKNLGYFKNGLVYLF